MAQIFVSYSRKDRKWVERLGESLRPLLKERNMSLWSDTEIKPGENWQVALEKSLNRSQAVILLISPDYLASKLVDAELPLIKERARKGELQVFPVIVSPLAESLFDLKNSSQDYQLVNSISEPLSILPRTRQEEIFMDLSNAISNSLPDKNIKTEGKTIYQSTDKYSIALNSAITSIGGNVAGINILGGRNIFFEAEERLAQKNGK